ncbi:MAG: hypothetical protein JJE52_16870 [Acidimicrobiia bacterium]|nr:hypothetical protein [Acidimicrobiia bacterium]
MTDEPRDPLTSLLDAVVYAPIGAVLHGPEAIEELAARGRQDITNARFIGRLALQRARREVDSFAVEAQERIGDLLAAAARAAGAPVDPSHASSDTDSAPDAAAADPAGSRLTMVPDAADDAPPSQNPTSSTDGGPGDTEPVADFDPVAAPDSDLPSADSLAIPGYDNLAASQVVPRLDDLGAEELAAVQHYERAHRGRMTILSRIAQLQAS